jgi:hypothetical protein
VNATKSNMIERERSQVLFDITKVAQYAARLQRNMFPAYTAALLVTNPGLLLSLQRESFLGALAEFELSGMCTLSFT